MNIWTELSIEYANQKSYLDDLYLVYPTIPDGIREIDTEIWNNIENAFNKRDNTTLIKELFKLDLFPVKDSYIAYLKRDSSSIDRNPQTINRICGRLYELGIEKLFQHCSTPKETNRQIGPMFRNCIRKGSLGIIPVGIKDFTANEDNAILDASDKTMQEFASEHLNYKHDKGLDFLARFNRKYVIGEAKFLTDFGGHQNAQYADAISLLKTRNVKAEKIAILDGVLYIKNNSKMYKSITNNNYNILSSLLLRNYLYQL